MSLLTRSRTESGEDPPGADPTLTAVTASTQHQQSQDQGQAAVGGLESFHSTEDLKFCNSTTLYCLDVHLKVLIECEMKCEVDNIYCGTGWS